jgi:S-adenosylmethionine synthetase
MITVEREKNLSITTIFFHRLKTGRKDKIMSNTFKVVVKTEVRPEAHITRRASVCGYFEKPEGIADNVMQALIRRQFETLATDDYANEYGLDPAYFIVSGEVVGDTWLNIKNATWEGTNKALFTGLDTDLKQPDVKYIRSVQLNVLAQMIEDIKTSGALFNEVEEYIDYYIENVNKIPEDIGFCDSYEDEEFNMKVVNIRIFDAKATVNLITGQVMFINDLMGIKNTTTVEEALAELEALTDEQIMEIGYHRSYNKLAGNEQSYTVKYTAFSEENYNEIFNSEDDYDEDEDDEDYDYDYENEDDDDKDYLPFG